MRNIDLDAARQARREALGEAPTFTFEGRTFELPLELPYGVIDHIEALAANERDLAALSGVMESILGSETYAEFRELKPSIADLNELVGAMFEEYNLGGKGEADDEGDGPGKG